MAQARSALLTANEIGRGWFSGRATNTGHITSACTGSLKADESDLVEVGKAGEFSTLGVHYLLQTVAVYKTPSQATAAWSRTRVRLVACMKKTLEGIHVRPVRDLRIQLPAVAGNLGGYREIGKFRVQGKVTTMYFDELLIRRARTVTRFFLTAFSRPFGKRFESMLARAISKRLQTSPPSTGPKA